MDTLLGNTPRRVAKNILSLFSMQFIGKICGMIFFVLIARKFGAKELGTFHFLFILTGFFSVFATLGLDTLTIREVARDKTKANLFFSNILALKTLSSAVSIIVMISFLYLFHYTNKEINLGILFSLMIFFTVSISLNDSIFQAFEHFEYSGLIAIMNNVFVLFSGLLLLHLNCKLWHLIVLIISGSAISNFIGWAVLSRRFCKIGFKINLNFWKYLFIEGSPFIFAAYLGVLYSNIDVVMLSKMSTSIAVGYYGAAYKIINAYIMLPGIFVAALFPILSRTFIDSKNSLQEISNRALRYLLIIAFPIVIFSIVDAKKIIFFLYGQQFENSILAFQILSIRGFTFFINTLLGYILFSVNKQKLYLKLTVFALMTNIVLNALLIPKYSYIGASLATAISAIFSFGLHYFFVSKNVCQIKVISSSVKPLLSMIFAVILLLLLRTGFLWDILIVLIVYSGCLIGLGGLGKDDYRMFRRILQPTTR